MSERKTGATDDQIVAAVDRELDEVYSFPWDDSESKRDLVYASIRNAAEFLVPPGQVITDAGRVPTDAEIGAMRLMAMLPEGRTPAVRRAREVVRAYLDRQKP